MIDIVTLARTQNKKDLFLLSINVPMRQNYYILRLFSLFYKKHAWSQPDLSISILEINFSSHFEDTVWRGSALEI